MFSFSSFGRFFIVLGFLFIVIGGILFLLDGLGFNKWKIPGDIQVEGGSFTCVIALGTSLLLSILVTIGLNILLRFLNR